MNDYIQEMRFKIEQLEKENAELKVSIDKIKNETFECDTCLDVCFENEKLEKENVELKSNLEAAQRTRDRVFDDILDIKSKLASIKTLDRQEVENIIYEDESFDTIITDICNLAIPQVRTSPFTDEQNEAMAKEKFRNIITVCAGNINDKDEGIKFDDIDKLVDEIGGSK